MAKPIVRITMDGGLIQDIEVNETLKTLLEEHGFEVHVWDFDTEGGGEEDNYFLNKANDGFFLAEWEPLLAPIPDEEMTNYSAPERE